ncbi:hypothetical protein FJZ36_17070 [Candidatus Poribacteria bacterium]|nr:hypothetical protein [Candidatus Poribacteria bacterium]
MERWRDGTRDPVRVDKAALEEESGADCGPAAGAILYVDIVGFSKLPLATARGLVEAVESEVSRFMRHINWRGNSLPIFVPTGDGFLVTYVGRCWLATALAIHLYKYLACWRWQGKDAGQHIRAGLHTGRYRPRTDTTGRANVEGHDIVIARRIVDFSDHGCHFLASERATAELESDAKEGIGNGRSTHRDCSKDKYAFSEDDGLRRYCDDRGVPYDCLLLSDGQVLTLRRIRDPNTESGKLVDKHGQEYDVFNVYASSDVGQDVLPARLCYADEGDARG